MTPDQRSLRDALAAMPNRVAATAEGTGRPPDAAPSPGEWSAREVALHLAAVEEEVWHRRLDALASERFPHWPWVEPGLWSGPGADAFEGALAAFRSRRTATIDRLDALDDDGWARTGKHDVYGILDVAAMLRILLAHDEEHLAQIAAG
ncbi:MAG TPA: DinB family protein [Candidatus Limnocylindrales bacterium]|nr:DinB family protein [Candidatus Limnocylindrales bacterium]